MLSTVASSFNTLATASTKRSFISRGSTKNGRPFTSWSDEIALAAGGVLPQVSKNSSPIALLSSREQDLIAPPVWLLTISAPSCR